MVAIVEGFFSEEDTPLGIPDTYSKIDELGAMINSLQQKVTKLVKEKIALTANTKQSDCYTGCIFYSSLMAFASKLTSRNAYCAQSCERTN